MSARAGWELTLALLDDERVTFVREPDGIEAVFPALLQHPTPTHKLVGDAYLAAFAICSERRFVTLDQGFRQFRGLQVDVIGST